MCVHAGTTILNTNTLWYFDGLVCVAVWASKINDAELATGIFLDIDDLFHEHDTEEAKGIMREAIWCSRTAFVEDT